MKLEFHNADTDIETDILTRSLADTSDFLKLFLWQAQRHSNIFVTILARISEDVGKEVRVGVGDVECQLNSAQVQDWATGFVCHPPRDRL